MRLPPSEGGYSTPRSLDIPQPRSLSLPLLALVFASTVAGLAVALLARRWLRADQHAPERVSRRARLLEPGAASGLALSVALVLLIVGGLELGGLAFVIRSDPDAIGLDASAARW